MRSLTLAFALLVGRLDAQTGCMTSATTWPHASFAAQRDSFAVEYDDTPAAAALDAQLGLSARPVTSYAELAASVRFNITNAIDALNDGAKTYAALAAVPYVPGTSYHIRMKVNVRSHRYSVWATPPGGTETLLAQDYGFRLGQDTVVALGYWTVYTSIATKLHTVCNFVVRSLLPQPPPPPPVTDSTVAMMVAGFRILNLPTQRRVTFWPAIPVFPGRYLIALLGEASDTVGWFLGAATVTKPNVVIGP